MITTIAFLYAYLTVAGLLSKFLGQKNEAHVVLMDLFWPLTIWHRAANYYLGEPRNMENFFLRK